VSKSTTYKLLLGNRNTKDSERAVLPTILYASKKETVGVTQFRVSALTIGWWAWGIGVMRTKVKTV